jgi:hypothetical protein
MNGVAPPCSLCDEPVLSSDRQGQLGTGEAVHAECLLRSVMGSVAHIQQRCGCFISGSTDGDPEGMSKRQAAMAAVLAFRVATYGEILNERGTCPACGSVEFHPGPRGGAARNIMCAGCGTKYWYSPPFAPTLIFSDDQFFDRDVRQRLLQ